MPFEDAFRARLRQAGEAVSTAVRQRFAPDDLMRADPGRWLLVIYAAMLAFHGFGESDMPDFLHLARDTTKVLAPPLRQFLYSSPLNFMLGDLLKMPTVFGFYLIHISEVLAMLATILVCVRKKFPANEDQVRFLALLSLTPLWLVTLKWLGKPDPILIGMLFLSWAYPGRWRWVFVSIMVMAHREMGSAMCLFLFLSEEERDYSLIVPLLIGHAFHYLYENDVLNFKPVSRVADITVDIWLHPREFIERPELYFIGSLSWYWLVALWQRPGVRLGFGMAAAFAIAAVSEDFTRDFILMALAPILFHLEWVVKTPSSHALIRFLPLGLFQIQIAAMGFVFKPGNLWIDWMTDNLGNQLLR